MGRIRREIDEAINEGNADEIRKYVDEIEEELSDIEYTLRQTLEAVTRLKEELY